MHSRPQVLALVLCDAIWVEPATQKKSLLGLIHEIGLAQFPALIGQLVAYIALTDAHGIARVRLRLVDVDEVRPPIADAELTFDFSAGPNTIAEAIFGMSPVLFPAAGDYRLQLRHKDELISERRLYVKQAYLAPWPPAAPPWSPAPPPAPPSPPEPPPPGPPPAGTQPPE